jgi:DNA-binding PadR family transcriptional regulator
MPKPRGLTELEGCVLGLIWEKSPCTAYAVRMEFLRSPSAHWSGSAGAIYPLVRRLERQHLIRGEAQGDRRRSKRYRLTSAGRQRLDGWLAPPFAPETIAVPPDPLRTRFRFLAALHPRQQVAFLWEAQTQIQKELLRCEADMASLPKADRASLWTARGALAALGARLSWLEEVARDRVPR